jgi:hypothetical protein
MDSLDSLYHILYKCLVDLVRERHVSRKQICFGTIRECLIMAMYSS